MKPSVDFAFRNLGDRIIILLIYGGTINESAKNENVFVFNLGLPFAVLGLLAPIINKPKLYTWDTVNI